MFMKKRIVLLSLVALAVVGAAVAQSQASPAQSLPIPTTSTLPNAFSANRYSLAVPDFGNVGYYSDTGGTGRPLLLLTSINAAANAYEMRPLFLAYQGKRPVYALEWPGFGSSDRPNIRYTPELMTSALRAMVNQIGQDVDVVALSLGSEFAARAALDEPRIRSLAFISPSGLGRATGATQVAAETQKAENRYRNLSNPIWAGPLYALIATKTSIRLFLNPSFQGKPDQGLIDYDYLATRLPGARYAPLYFIGGVLFTPDAYGQLYSKVNQPMLVLYDRDAFVNFDRLNEFTAARPNASAVRVTPTKGLPHFEQLGQVTAALDAFWAAQK
jgi:pimeloyl-ACP methyl ester carboxylesterase